MAVNLLPFESTQLDISQIKNGFGLGFYDEKSGELTHHTWIEAEGENGPYTVHWMSYKNYDQFLELLSLLKSLGDQVYTVKMKEPSEIQIQGLLTKPFRYTEITRQIGELFNLKIVISEKGGNMGNFTLIAKRITYIYEYLKSKYLDRYENEDELLSITGMIDAIVYLNQNQLRVQDIVDVALFSRYNAIKLLPHHIPIYEFMENFRKDRLLNFTLNLEDRLFAIDTRIDGQTILYALKKKRDLVLKAVQRTRVKARKRIPNNIIKLVDAVIDSTDLSKIKAIISDIYRNTEKENF